MSVFPCPRGRRASRPGFTSGAHAPRRRPGSRRETGSCREAAVTQRAQWVGEAGPRRPAPTKETQIKLRILDDIVAMIGRIHRLCRRVARHDSSLAKQMREASSSVGLNSGEGLYANGGNRTKSLEVAMNSGRETILGLRISGAAGYLEQNVVAREVDEIDRIVATLYKLTYRSS
jgi:four helix bundle protein